MPEFNRQRAAQVLVDAALTDDQRAAAKWQISDRTVRSYRAALASDPELAELFQQGMAAALGPLGAERRKFLRDALAKLGELVAKADGPEHITDVADAVKVVGDLDLAADVLNVGTGDHPQGPVPPEAEGGSGSGEADPRGPAH